jgi:hypothetical protein
MNPSFEIERVHDETRIDRVKIITGVSGIILK